ncbi:hypothetical protein [Acetivibrio cellulolyticus]|uniref:hypothetical protein n=1 Tax=Acetivibrio cellulolyticus TaxID=35830 RepID=UPI0001E2F594|nr:hypothetical protein [Acetivibrio cellulolyticus]
MLNKLIKYEFKATARIFIPLYIALMAFAIINKFSINILNETSTALNFRSIIGIVSMFAYISLMVGIQVITFVVLVQRFYKSLLGDEGYLMFTIPVKPLQHILCKLFTSMVWLVLSGLSALLSILIIMPNNAYMDMLQVIPEAVGQVFDYFGSSTIFIGFESIIICILSVSSGILMVYAAISLGHLFSKHKLLASFGMYLALSTAIQFIQVLFMVVLGNSLFKEFSSMPTLSQIQIILISIFAFLFIVTAGCFIITKYILDKKLNLE